VSDEPLRVISNRPEHLLLASPRLFVSIHDGPTTLASVAAESNYAKKKMGTTPSSVGCLVILGANTPPPEPEVRAVLPKLLDDIAPASAGLAMVIEGAGFRAAVLRAIFSGVLALKRLPYRASVFDTSRPALDWLATRVAIDAAARDADLVRLRREHGLHPEGPLA